MKKGLIIVLVLAVLLLGLPFADGFWVEKKYHAVAKLVSQRTPLSVQIIDYQRGWFSSAATVKFTVDRQGNNPTTSAEKIQFIVKEKLYHGPVILRSDNPRDSFGKNITFAIAISEIHVRQPDLQVSTLAVYHYNGSVGVKFDCPLISINNPATIKSTETVAIQGLKGQFSFSRRFKRCQGEIQVASADIPLQGGHQIIKNATYRYSLDKNGYDLWYGNRTLEIGDLLLNSTDNLEAQGLMLALSDNVISPVLNSHLKAQVSTLKINNTNYGKQQIVFNMANLNLPTLSELAQKADLLDQRGTPLSIRAIELTPLALQLVSKGLSLNLSSMDLNTKWGTLHGNASLEIKKQNNPPAQFLEILGNISAQAELTFPIKMLEDILEIRYQALTTPEQQKQSGISPEAMAKDNIDRWVLAGWLIPVDNHYQMNLSYKMNELLLNGKPMKVPSLSVPENPLTTPKR